MGIATTLERINTLLENASKEIKRAHESISHVEKMRSATYALDSINAANGLLRDYILGETGAAQEEWELLRKTFLKPSNAV